MNRTPETLAWVAALRSGKYKQARGRLRREPLRYDEASPSYCCLGVLCAITDEFKRDGDTMYFATLPADVREKHGITIAEQQELVRLNDEECRTFEQIADRIEEMMPDADD